MIANTPNGLHVCDFDSCPPGYQRHIGIDMFHGHVAALAVAGHANKRAGRKVERVIVAKGHFMVVPA